MRNPNRPLSPHLGVYRWGLHMALSIFHRATGVALALGAVLMVWWLFALASGPDYYAMFMDMTSGIIGRLVLFGVTMSLIFHALNGIRHLYWDIGRGFAVETVRRTGIVVVGLTLVITLAIWAYAYGLWSF